MKRFGMVLLGIWMAAIFLAPSAHASTNDFTISKFNADYYLSRDKDNRSTLRTVEEITAEFPQVNQNHGIERALPTKYRNHPTHLAIESVRDAAGKDLPYTTYKDGNDNLVVRIGDADTYVHGSRTYVVSYTQRDVTEYFANTNDDEFYWDTNGTQWRQPFGEVTARIHIDESLRAKLTGDMSCYYGAEGATNKCSISNNDSVITATTSNLTAGQNMTVALGFAPHTFAAYEPTLFERLASIWLTSLFMSSAAGFVLIFVIAYRHSAVSNRKKDIGTVVAEYLPPKDASVLVSAQISESAQAVMAAQIIDLAVRHYLRLYQTKEKSFMKQAEYELEIIKPLDSLTDEERQFIKILFTGKNTSVGSRLEMKNIKSNYVIGAKLQKATKALETQIKGKYGLRKKDESASRWFKTVGKWATIISIITISPLLFIAGIVAFVCGVYLFPFTNKGLDLRRYLMGLKLYIGVAEEERLKMLQSPEGADKVGTTIDGNPKELVKLYERVLPYAVLFGREKEWNKQLGVYYTETGTSPDWYSGHAAFSAAMFTSAMSDFSSTTNSYATSTGSSAGGSSGGGSSGGGGGGGGGGGW